MGEDANEERAQQIFEKSNKIEEQFGDLLTGRKKPFAFKIFLQIKFLF